MLSTKSNITPNGHIENDTGDNSDEAHSFSLGLTIRDNDTKTDFDHDAEDELYIREDHFEGIFIEKTSEKRKQKIKGKFNFE